MFILRIRRGINFFLMKFSTKKIEEMHNLIEDKPQVTLVLGTFKNPDLIIPTIKGFLDQTYKNFKVFIVDDNSPFDEEIIKKSKSIVESFNDERLIYVKNDVNIGVPHVFRKWINLVDTKYFYITGAGDFLLPNALSLMVGFLEKHPNASMVHGLETKGDNKKEESLFFETGMVDPRLYLEYHLIGGERSYSWSQSSALFRTELWKIRNIPVVHDHYWDFYFHCKYILFSEKIGYLNEYVAVREKSPFSYETYVIENYLLAKVERLYQALKFIDEHEFYMLLRGYPINNYRYKIAKKLIKQSFYVQQFDEAVYCIFKGFVILFKIIFSKILYYLSRPFGVLFKRKKT